MMHIATHTDKNFEGMLKDTVKVTVKVDYIADSVTVC